MSGSILLILCLFLVAIMYSSVGHGGASGYLAIMSIFAVSTIYFRSSALLLNLFVAAIAFVTFRSGFSIRWRLFLPLILPSLPMAFLGAKIQMNPEIYKMILGVLLLLAVFRLLYKPSHSYDVKPEPSVLLLVLIGSALGLISGMIGIGGGIILSPILILTQWAGVKETAIYSSLFIFLNSVAGLLGLGLTNMVLPPAILFWVLAAIIGGVIGSSASVRYLPVTYFKYSLAIVLLFACFKLMAF